MANTISDDRIRLLDIADSLQEIQGYIGQGEFKDYTNREDVREAVVSQLQQVGGAAALLSDEFKEKYGNIDWNILIGLQYANFDAQLELDLHPMWNIVHNDLPEIMDEVLDLASMMEDEEDLSDVALNEEDLRDIKEQRKAKYTATSQPVLDEDINLVDESELNEYKSNEASE